MWADALKFMALLRPQSRRYAMGLASLLLVNVAEVFAPVFMAVAIDLTEAALTGVEAQTPTLLSLVGVQSVDLGLTAALLAYLGLQVTANLFRYPMLMNTAVPSHQLGQDMRNRLIGHLMALSRPFFDRQKSGDLMSLQTNDINAVRMALGPGVLVGVDTLMIVSLVLLVLFGLSWKLTLITMIPLPLIVWVTNKLSHAEHDLFKDVQEDLGWLTERARESYAGIRIVQGYAREDFDRARFESFSQRHLEKNLKLARVRSLFDPTLDLMLGISTTLVLIFGGLQVVNDEITLGSFVAFVFLVRYLAGPMIGFGWSVSLFQRGRASLSRLERLFDEDVEIQDAPDAVDADGPGELEFRGLSFAYAGEPPTTGEAPAAGEAPVASVNREPALRDVSVKVPAGGTLGVIGPVGSGKSTLVSLLVRLYEPPPGTIFLDGRDVREVTLESLRRQVVLAPQDTFLFGDTVSRNLSLGQDGLAQASVEGYARLAHLHDELEALPEAYETLLGERGVNLSGGQRQRLAIARALAAEPRVLVLDDCLSAVDARTEEAILNKLNEGFEGRTGIVISHRVIAVRRCDHILVLEDGRVSQQGSHESLMAQPGYYSRIAREQMSAEDGSPEGVTPSGQG